MHRRCSAWMAALSIALASTDALAQVHWDAAAQIGVMKRFLVDRPASSQGAASFGPIGQLSAHAAILPLVHVGAFVSHDISPLSGSGTRTITSGGLRAKAVVPWIKTLRAWVFAGFGYAGTYAHSYHTTFAIPDGLGGTTPTDVRVEGAGGGFFEVPVGIGASYKLRGPWRLVSELAFRTGFGHSGSVYTGNGPQVTVPGGGPENAAPAGLDRFGVALTVGVMLDE